MKQLNPVLLLSFLLPLVLLLTGCVSGGMSNPWDYKSDPAPAQEQPSDLSQKPDMADRTIPEGIYREQYQDFEARNHPLPGSTTGEAPTYTQTSPQYSIDGLYDQQQARPQMDKVKVALLLPLSGQNEKLGKSMLKSAQMALFDVGHNNFELLPQDTAGTARGAGDAARKAIDEGAQLILGPLFSHSVQSVKTVARSHNINVIAFSTDWRLADRRTFLMGFLPFDQVERIARYAAAQTITNVGALIPATQYGSAVQSTFQSAATANGLQIVDTRRVDVQNRNLTPFMREFTRYDMRNPFDPETGEPMPDDAPKAPLPFEAIFMPIGGEIARTLSNLSFRYDMGPHDIKLLGTGVWDDVALAHEPAMGGALFAGPSPALRRSFETRYQELYGKAPERLATLSYDATALAAILAQTGIQQSGKPAFDARSISNPNGFAGIDGIFRFYNNGIVERGLAVLEFKNGKIIIADDAPQTFQTKSF